MLAEIKQLTNRLFVRVFRFRCRRQAFSFCCCLAITAVRREVFCFLLQPLQLAFSPWKSSNRVEITWHSCRWSRDVGATLLNLQVQLHGPSARQTSGMEIRVLHFQGAWFDFILFRGCLMTALLVGCSGLVWGYIDMEWQHLKWGPPQTLIFISLQPVSYFIAYALKCGFLFGIRSMFGKHCCGPKRCQVMAFVADCNEISMGAFQIVWKCLPLRKKRKVSKGKLSIRVDINIINYWFILYYFYYLTYVYLT